MAGKKDNKKDKKSKKEPSFIIKSYLLFYNVAQTLGWSYLLLQVLWYFTSSQPNNASLYETVKWTVIIFQNSAVLEIFHAMTGIVPSNVMITIFQVYSRVMLVCGVLMPTEEGRSAIGLPLCLVAWSLAEIIRYSYYALNILKMVPYVSTWLRYSGFMLLYPVGITGELLCLYGALKEVGRTDLWTLKLPNAINFSFYYQYYILIIILLYIPLSPRMYSHMLAQRKKILG